MAAEMREALKQQLMQEARGAGAVGGGAVGGAKKRKPGRPKGSKSKKGAGAVGGFALSDKQKKIAKIIGKEALMMMEPGVMNAVFSAVDLAKDMKAKKQGAGIVGGITKKELAVGVMSPELLLAHKLISKIRKQGAGAVGGCEDMSSDDDSRPMPYDRDSAEYALFGKGRVGGYIVSNEFEEKEICSKRKVRKGIPPGLAPYTVANKAIKGMTFQDAAAKQRIVEILVQYYDPTDSIEQNVKDMRSVLKHGYGDMF